MNDKKITVVLVLICLTAFFSGMRNPAAYAASGWVNDGGDWRYLDGNGVPVTDDWKQSGDGWYYLEPDGKMARNKLLEWGNSLYYVNESGKRAEDKWINVDNEYDGQYEAGWYYFITDGRACRGAKKQIGGKDYVFDGNGRLITGWLSGGLQPLGESADPLVDGSYYAGPDGALLKNAWLDYSATDSFKLPETESQISGLSYGDYKEMWLYFGNNFSRFRGSGDQPRQKNIGGYTYGFDENGVMLPWWSRVEAGSDSLPVNPTTASPQKFYSPYNGGRLLRDSWIYMYPSKDLDPQEYSDEKYSWWHTDGNGAVYQNAIKKIHGKSYAFDGLGRMQAGFVIFRGRDRFVARYDTDQYGSDDFKEGRLLGMEEGNDLYLFAPDAYNDGSMQTGRSLKAELADGVFTFGFASNGIAYGNHELGRAGNSYYINGLRLDADADYGYGVVVDKNGDGRLVNGNGQLVTGNKKVLKDLDGGWLILLNGRFMARVTDEEKPRWNNGPEGPGFYHYDRDTKYGAFITDGTGGPQLDTLPQEELLYQAGI